MSHPDIAAGIVGQAAEPSQEAPAEGSAPPILSLHDYFRQEKPAAGPFLSGLRKAKPKGFEPDDVQAALRTLPETDPEFQKCFGLAQRALVEKSNSLAHACFQFVGQAVRQRLAAEFNLDIDLETPAPDVFQAVAYAVKPALADKKLEKRAMALLLAAALWLFRTRQLDYAHVITTLRELVQPPDNTKQDPTARQIQQNNYRFLAQFGSRAATLKALADFIGPWIAQAQHMRSEAARQEQAASALRRDKEALERALADAQADLAASRARLAEAESRVASLEKALDEERVGGRHRVTQVKADIQGFLTAQIMPLVADAGEAASLNPPRVHVVAERVETIGDRIGRKIEWLKSSD
ncbi:hypothetical protein D9623_00420 [Azospirillum brasilense]|uniref:Uncharacterized protein n=1 Tax=Azospirillum brasilense TaxID=192 RepID=A0A0P0EQH7_AZOBR|nr:MULTISPECIES: hypothetical protein [Azospirillum]ALJ34250.1 hypothetical protein AMK58_01790 [Azospirillum brasilense]MDW7552761.1 hypothetical protein [Azospirillum brasilense]MDW7592047.1 hypothetical protein [Azospirillum brasilense]MDW7627676.1 hypothetical protein [Azospirillum brasilense]MDX5952855.1 hypothetical protein [Azospirillum brasilense]